MLTRISKILAVVMAVVSVAVLATVWVATLIGGPNWKAEAIAASDFTFTLSDDIENPTWSAQRLSETRGQDGKLARKSYSPKALLPEVIYDARKDVAGEQAAEIAQLKKDIADLKDKHQRAEALIKTDTEAIKKREESLLAERDALNAEIAKTRQETSAKVAEVDTISADIARRRNDVLRLQNELGALRADKYRMVDQQKKLADLLVRLEGNIGSLERREKQLVDQGASDGNAKPAE